MFVVTLDNLNCLLKNTTPRLLDPSTTIAPPLSLKGSSLQFQTLELKAKSIFRRNFPIMTSESSHFVPSQAVNEQSTLLSVDQDGTCRIYYCCPNHLDTSDYYPRNKAEVRNLEFHFHLQPDNLHDRTPYPSLPSMAQFQRECPIWSFTDAGDKTPKPTCNIILAFHGTGKVPDDYHEMLNQLLCLMDHLTTSGYEEVSVKVLAGTFGLGGKRLLPSDLAMAELRRRCENYMGTAEVIGDGEATRLEFRPRPFRIACLEKRNAARSAWAAYISDPKKIRASTEG